jgi:hypothetical protein
LLKNKITIGIPKEAMLVEGMDQVVKDNFIKMVNKLKEKIDVSKE